MRCHIATQAQTLTRLLLLENVQPPFDCVRPDEQSVNFGLQLIEVV